MNDPLSRTAAALQLITKLIGVINSLRPLIARFRSRTDLDRFAEEFFAGDLVPGAGIRVRGVLCPYNCSIPALAYKPWVAAAVDERVEGYEVESATGRVMKRVTLSVPKQTLSPPVSRLNDVKLADGTDARIAWLYPEGFTGLLFDVQAPAADSAPFLDTSGFADLLTVRPEQQPVLCLLPISGKYDVLFGSTVEVVGEVIAADSQLAALLTDSLDQFRLAFFSRCICPFEGSSLCLAIDLRGPVAYLRRISHLDNLDVVIGVQALIEIADLTDDETSRAFVAAADTIPDRAGLGPLRAIGDQSPQGVLSVLSTGDIRWVFDQNAQAIAAYSQVNLADREQTLRSITELAHHWQAWQKHARQAIQSAVGRSARIQPLFVWDSEKFHLFHPDGLRLPPRLEAQLFDRDPAIRKAIDWLRVGTGRLSQGST